MPNLLMGLTDMVVFTALIVILMTPNERKEPSDMVVDHNPNECCSCVPEIEKMLFKERADR